MAEDREISKGIVVNPHRCSGTPCIKGTRVFAQHIGEFALDKPHRAEWLADQYGITLNDVVNAKLWVKRGR